MALQTDQSREDWPGQRKMTPSLSPSASAAPNKKKGQRVSYGNVKVERRLKLMYKTSVLDNEILTDCDIMAGQSINNTKIDMGTRVCKGFIVFRVSILWFV